MRAEMRHYRARCVTAHDAPSLAALRLECASLLADALALDVSGPDLPPSLTDAISFYAYPDARPALEQLAAAGLKLGVVANWDISLHDVLARVGLAGAFEAVVTAAAVGAAKPASAAVRSRAEESRRRSVAVRPRRRRSRHGRRRRGGDRHLRAPDRPQRPRSQTHCAISRSSPAARGDDVTPPVARDPGLRVPGNLVLIVTAWVIISYLAVGAVQFALVPTNVDIVYSPTAMLLTIALYGSIGAAVLWAARRDHRRAPRARPRRPALVATRRRPRTRRR